MHPDLIALLQLQNEDAAIASMEARQRDLDGQLASLDREHAEVTQSLEQLRTGVAAEEQKRHDLTLKVQAHKELQARNLATLELVKKAKEATAAMAQIDLVQRALAQEENDIQSLSARIRELQQSIERQQAEVADTEQRQEAARAEIAGKRAAIDEELQQARATREVSAERVSRAVLIKYERIRGRSGSSALYPLRGSACGRCNTAIPLQRRNVIAAGRSVEVCEGCGALLYAAS
ncbi:MAG TPA: hypothetical protein VFW98_15720 [Gemmatimonadaceae bacterium]|nr:hypothetical protein [Gemmatimonadaceae bacterium]